MIISLENAEFFIGIFSHKDTTAVHSYLVSGVVQNGKVIPLITFGRKGNHERAFLINEPLMSVNMYEAYSISFDQYQELLERVGYISHNQPTRYQSKLLSQKKFRKKKLTKRVQVEETYYSERMYFSVDPDNPTKLHYKFVTPGKKQIKDTLSLSEAFSQEDLNKYAETILDAHKIESNYQLKLLSEKAFEKTKLTKRVKRKRFYYSGEMYFSVDPDDPTKLHYKFVTHRKIPLQGTLSLSEAFSRKRLNQYARAILDDEIELLSEYESEIIEPFTDMEYPCESLSFQDFDAIKADDLQLEEERFYFSHEPDNPCKLQYKFCYQDYFWVGELYLEKEKPFSPDSLDEYRKRVIAKESDFYFGIINNDNIQSREKFYFSHKPNDTRKLQYKFCYRGRFLVGELDLLQPFSDDDFDEYRKRVIAKEGSLLSGYVPKKDNFDDFLKDSEEELHFEILREEEFHGDDDEELLAHISAPISPLNNCRTATLEISESTLGFKPKTSGFFFKKPAYRISVIEKELNANAFYILPQPPELFDDLSKEQEKILKKLHKRLRELPKIDPTSEITRQKFDILKKMYLEMAGERSASLDSLLEFFTKNRKDSEILFTPRSFFSTIFPKQTSTESLFIDCESRLKKGIGS